MSAERTALHVYAAAALVFATSAAVTALWYGPMSAMHEMPMPGGWTMSMTWMRMSGQGSAEHAGTFLGMWAAMMTAMMTPALAPEIVRFRRGLAATRRERLSWVFAAGYFGVWTTLGLALYPLGVAFAELAMRSEVASRMAPWLGSLVVIAAGALQFSRWKLRQLESCRHHGADDRRERTSYADALRAGTRLGLRCVYCCAGLVAVLVVTGVMDLVAMTLVTIAISAERLAPAHGIAPRSVGAAVLSLGVFWVARAAGY